MPHNFPIVSSQQAATGALEIYVEGCRRENVRQQLFGLAVLRSATAAQIHAAMPVVQARQGVTLPEIQAMLAR